MSSTDDVATGPQVTPAWHDHIWLGIPIALIAIGGAVGGAFGGAAFAINEQVFRATRHPILRYVWTGLISLSAVIAYLIIAAVVLSN